MFKGRELEGRKVSQNVVKKFLVGQKLGKGVRACVCESVRPSVWLYVCAVFRSRAEPGK